MGTKNNPGKSDCYANAEPDEPMFVLLGRDKHAPTLVWLWATLRELDGAFNMMKWAYEHDRQVVGIGQAALAGVMELIMSVNGATKLLKEEHKNQATDIEVMRLFLGATEFEPERGS